MKIIPSTLLNAAAKRSIVPIIGAGVSMSLRNIKNEAIFPSWKEVLERAADYLDQENKADHALGVRAMIRLGNYQQAASTAKSGLVGSLWHNFLRSCFEISKDEIEKTSMLLSEEIWNISNHIITLNYDNVLEFSAPASGITRSIVNSRAANLSDFIRNDLEGNSVWHLHGHIEDVSSIIFTTENYSELYVNDEEYRAAVLTLTTIAASSNFLFIGCSLEDAELLQQLNSVHQLFDENTGPHYVLVREKDSLEIQQKLCNLPLQLICFSDFGPPLLELVKNISSACKKNSIAISPQPPSKNIPSVTRAAILTASPLDRFIDHEDIKKEINKLKIELNHFPLNIRSLHSLSEFNYIFILTSIVKEKIIIEDEWLSATRTTITDLLQNVGQSSVDGIFVFTDAKEVTSLQLNEGNTLDYPIAIYPQLEKTQIKSHIFQLFQRKNVSHSNALVLNKNRFNHKEISSKANVQYHKTTLSEGIDPKSTRGFIGRLTDLQSITKHVLEIFGNGEFLTVKGSGGIGKTITLKKVCVELAERGLFNDGIEFIDCEFVVDYKLFEQNVARLFNLELAADFKKQTREHVGQRDMLLVLDNLETMLHGSDANLITDLISFLSDFFTVVITSREVLHLDNERIYELRSLTTEEAFQLFIKNAPAEINTDNDKRFVREQIVESLLDNNPLAIKLITRSIPKGVDYRALARELEKDIFTRVTDEYISTFDSAPDSNVERKRSLYASINFSYLQLSEKERVAFELLSLFPDGINIERFKAISGYGAGRKRDTVESNNPVNQFMITDSLIRSLENKSIVQIDNNRVGLQSLLGRFSEKKFQERSQEDIARFYRNAFIYNASFAEALLNYRSHNTLISIKTFNSHQMNFLKCVEYLPQVPLPYAEICDYVRAVTSLSINLCACRPLYKALEPMHRDSGETYEQLYIDIKKIQLRYFDGEFEGAYRELQNIFPIESIFKIDPEDRLGSICAVTAANIYSMEGEALHTLLIESKYGTGTLDYPDSLFLIGEHDVELAESGRLDLYRIETLMALGKLSLEKIDTYIDGLYEKQKIDIMQANYIRTKLVGKPKIRIQKLVIANLYTAGLKSLIQAFSECSLAKKKFYYEEAIQNLFHIKYYYVEALFFYASFLKQSDYKSYQSIFEKGQSLAQKHGFRYLLYRFEFLDGKTNLDYCAENYPLEGDEPWKEHILKIKNKTKNRMKSLQE